MSRALLDTHALLWFLSGDGRLSNAARGLIEEPTNSMLVSVATLWEIAIKRSNHKLAVPDGLLDLLSENGLDVLPIEAEHAWAVARLPISDHKDPFDRLLVAQAMVEGVPIISRDARLDQYEIKRIW